MKSFYDRILKWFLRDEFYPDIQGDLNEIYADNLKRYSKRKTNYLYLLEVIKLFRPSLIGFKFFRLNYLSDMLKNYLKIGFRSLSNQASFTLMNILGLSIGLAVFLLISIYVSFEKSYDSHFSDIENLYRLTTDQEINGTIATRDAMSFSPSGSALKEELPEVKAYTTTLKLDDLIFRKDDKVQIVRDLIVVDKYFLSLFDYAVLYGKKEGSLDEPNEMVITKDKALEYFGKENAVGETVEILGGFNQEFTITAVIENVPKSTHYKFEWLMSAETMKENFEEDAWRAYNYYTYVKLQNGVKPRDIDDKVKAVAVKYLREGSNLRFNLQPVSEIHLYSNMTFEPETHGDATSVKIMQFVSYFILILAWVNYINLSTARALSRAKEVGLRKVIGAGRQSLIGQFFTESFIVNFFAGLVAILLAQLTLPLFQSITGSNLIEPIFFNQELLLQSLLFVLIGTFISGFYPALVLSSFKPLRVLKGNFSRSNEGRKLRKVLVIFQFSISFLLITGTQIVSNQIDYMQSKDKGIKVKDLVGYSAVRGSGDREEEISTLRKTFRDKIRQFPEVEKVAVSSNMPGGGSNDIWSASGQFYLVGEDEKVESTIYLAEVNDLYFPTLSSEILAGRNFSRDIASDSSSIIINEAMMHLLGQQNPEDIVGREMQRGRDKVRIVAVIKDYQRSSMKLNTEPTVFHYGQSGNFEIIKFRDGQMQAGMEKVNQVWSETFPESPFDYLYIDERYRSLYEQERQFEQLVMGFSMIAILIAVLGLFGLSSHSAIQRRKEMSVRKVLGASIGQLTGLFLSDFMVVVLVAGVLGIPIAYFLMNQWLNGFAFHIDFPWQTALYSVILLLVITGITILYQTFRLVAVNPSDTLRNE